MKPQPTTHQQSLDATVIAALAEKGFKLSENFNGEPRENNALVTLVPYRAYVFDHDDAVGSFMLRKVFEGNERDGRRIAYLLEPVVEFSTFSSVKKTIQSTVNEYYHRGVAV